MQKRLQREYKVYLFETLFYISWGEFYEIFYKNVLRLCEWVDNSSVPEIKFVWQNRMETRKKIKKKKNLHAYFSLAKQKGNLIS